MDAEKAVLCIFCVFPVRFTGHFAQQGISPPQSNQNVAKMGPGFEILVLFQPSFWSPTFEDFFYFFALALF